MPELMANIKTVKSSLIQSLLEDPQLPEKVRGSSAAELRAWIEEIGLEDAGEIVAFATVPQLEEVFDADLWTARETGGDEAFDAERFGVWLEILSELGFEKAARKISGMDEDFLVMAFGEMAWVAELDWLGGRCETDPRLEKLMESRLTFEVDAYVVFGRSERGWDAFVSLIAELDAQHHAFLYRILGRCFETLARDIGDEDELFDLLSAGEQLAEDVADAREQRREARGFVSPAAARAFLKLCEMDPQTEDLVTPKALLRPPSPAGAKTFAAGTNALRASPRRFPRIVALLEKYPGHRDPLIEQLNYLANALMAGWNWNGEEPRAGRALEIALTVCEEGLGISQEPFVSLPRTFRIGWKSATKRL